MPTKAELEAELKSLRAELALNRNARARHVPDPEINTAERDEFEVEDEDKDKDKDKEAQRQLGDLMNEFATTAENNPGLALFGVFIAGMLFGRYSGR